MPRMASLKCGSVWQRMSSDGLDALSIVPLLKLVAYSGRFFDGVAWVPKVAPCLFHGCDLGHAGLQILPMGGLPPFAQIASGVLNSIEWLVPLPTHISLGELSDWLDALSLPWLLQLLLLFQRWVVTISWVAALASSRCLMYNLAALAIWFMSSWI